MLLSCFPIAASAAGETVTTVLDLNESGLYVFDLSKASVKIGATATGTGYVYNETDSKWELGSISVTHADTNKYYIFQSSTKTSVTLSGSTLTLTETDIDNEIIINKTNVNEVIANWASAATDREATSNFINVGDGKTENAGTYNVTIDSIWSTARTKNATYQQDAGGFVAYSKSAPDFKVTLSLKGDNRLEHLYYCNNSETNGSSLTITNGAAQGAPTGSLTVISDQQIKFKTDSTYYIGNLTYNHWNSVIGADDSLQAVYNLNFTGGVIYAGATEKENCTAIGAGGNGNAKISISGENTVITAVTHSTGTAIGGGIAHTGSGGEGDVTISGGTVYAYNFGVFALNRVPRTQSGYATTDETILNLARHVPGTAIGGAGSIRQAGSKGTVNISGGTVYAESLGGAAIGGGSTVGFANNGAGGIATVTITGGNVTAKSVGGTLISTVANGNQPIGTVVTVDPGTGIGGGSSMANVGGAATVKIEGGEIYATGIGGGGSIEANGGYAEVTIEGGRMTSTAGIGGGTSRDKDGGDATVKMSGGTAVADGIGGGFSTKNGYATGTVIVTGGSLNSAMAAVPVNSENNGEVLQLTRASFFHEQTSMNDTLVTELRLLDDTQYNNKDIYTDSVGMIYLWLPEGSGITLAQLNNGSENYTPNDEPDRIINTNDMGALIYDSSVPRYIVTIAGSKYYSLFHNELLSEQFYGSVIVEGGTFLYYLTKNEECTLTPYIGTTDTEGNKVIIPNSGLLEQIGTNAYRGAIYVQGNTTVWYEAQTSEGKFFVVDLSAGNVTITEQADGSLTIQQGGYVLTNYTGNIYLTSAGYPTSNTVTVKSDRGADSDIDIFADDLTVVSNGPAFSVESGYVDLTFGSEDNLIHSVNDSPVFIGDEGANGTVGKLTVTTNGTDSIKLSTSKADTSIIAGPGTLNLIDEGGFLKIGEVTGDTSQIAVGEFNITATETKYSAELYRGKYSYKVVGYVQDNKLYPPNTDTKGKSFSARGIHEIYNGVESDITFDEVNNILKVVISVTDDTKNMGYYKVTVPVPGGDFDITEMVNPTVTDNKTVTFSISGAAFINGNLTITAAVEGKIPYVIQGSAEDVTYTYDGNGHSITAMFDTSLFEVFYSTSAFTAETVLTNEMKAEIEYVNVGTYEVFYYIRERTDVDNTAEYTDVSGSAELEITPGTNEWILELECSDVVCGSTPTPFAKAKWGEVQYTFYYDNGEIGKPDDVPEKITDFSVITDDTNFYVVASVEADGENYEAISSNPVYFRALKLSAYATTGRQLDKMASGATDALQIANRGTFSAYYKVQGDGEWSKLEFTRNMPQGTKITMLVFFGDSVGYYHYTMPNDGNSVSLMSFVKMGVSANSVNANYAPPSSGAVEYQFCFEYTGLTFSEGNIGLNVKLNGDSEVKLTQMLTVEEQLQAIEETSNSQLIVEGGYESIKITVKPKINGTGHKYLVFRIGGKFTPPNGSETDFALVNVESALAISATVGNENTSQILSPASSTNDMLMFYLGHDTSVNRQYTLILDNLAPGTYDLEVSADVRLHENEVKDCHVLQNAIVGENSVTKKFAIYVDSRVDFYVEPAEGSRLFDGTNECLVFNVKAPDAPATLAIQLNATIYIKQNGVYIPVKDVGPLTVNQNVIKIQGNDLSERGIIDGTYRIEFKYQDQSCICNVIVELKNDNATTN